MPKDRFSEIFYFKGIQNISEIWIFKKPTFLKFWKKSPKLFINKQSGTVKHNTGM
jgi:hypothetical protein